MGWNAFAKEGIKVRKELIYILSMITTLSLLACGQQPGKEWLDEGNALAMQGNYIEAVQAYNEAIKIDPEYAAAWNNKGLALDEMGEYEEAILAYEEALKLDPEYADAWYNKGNALYSQGEYQEAIEAYDEAIKLHPEDAEAWNNRGVALRGQGKCAEAIMAYDEAIRLDSEHADAWYNKGNALQEQRKYAEAIVAYDEAIRLDSEHANAWYNKGNALYYQGKYDEAIRAYYEAIRLDPECNPALDNRDLALEALERTTDTKIAEDEGIADYDEPSAPGQATSGLPREEGDAAATLTDQGDVFFSQGRIEDALRCYEEAILIDPDFERAHLRRYFALINLFRIEESNDAMNDYLRAQHNNSMEKEHQILQTMMGEWHLPGGDVEITEGDLVRMEETLKDHPTVFKETAITPVQLFVYSILKCHHTNGNLVLPSSVHQGIENLSLDWQKRYEYNVPGWQKVAILEFWMDYINRDFSTRSDFGKEDGIIADFVDYGRKELFARTQNAAEIMSLQTEVYIHDANVMSDIRRYEERILEREEISADERSAYLAEWSAEWAVGQAEYEVWRSQRSRIEEGTY